MFSVKDAVQSYKASAYQCVEYDLRSRIGGASIPIVGGFVGGVKSFANGFARPFRVAGSFLFGNPADPAAVEKTPIPADIANGQYGKDMEALRQNMRERADNNADAVGYFCSGEFQKGFRQWSAAEHQAARGGILMPEDSQPGFLSAVVGGALGGAIEGTMRGVTGSDGPLGAIKPGLPMDLPRPSTDTGIQI